MGRQVMDGEMKTLTDADVAHIYKTNYWNRIRGDDLPSGLDLRRSIGRLTQALVL